MTPKKPAAIPAARKNVPPAGKPFQKGHDPRRNVLKAGPGRPPDEFKERMRQLASREETLERLDQILSGTLTFEKDTGEVIRIPVDSDTYLKALAFVADRGYGKAQAHIDVTTGGESIADILRKGRDRVARMRNPESEA